MPTMTKSTSQPSRKAARQSEFEVRQLYAIMLERSLAEIRREAYWLSIRGKKKLRREIGATFKATDVEGDHFNISAEFILSVIGDADEAPVLQIACTFVAHFHTKSKCKVEDAEQFAQSNGESILWPYFRQTVSDLTSRMHIPPFTVPLSIP